MADDDLVAVAAGTPDGRDDAVAHGHDGRAGGRAVVDALMWPDIAEDGMASGHAVARGDAQEGQGRFHDLAAQVFALGVVIGFAALFIVEEVGRVALAAVDEARTENPPVSGEGVAPEAFFHQHFKGVAFPQVGDEVDF